jgi:hypothetical protein
MDLDVKGGKLQILCHELSWQFGRTYLLKLFASFIAERMKFGRRRTLNGLFPTLKYRKGG